MRLLPDSSERAACDGLKPSSSIAARTLARVAGDTDPLPLTTLDAVPNPTPASRATSLMVATGASLLLLRRSCCGPECLILETLPHGARLDFPCQRKPRRVSDDCKLTLKKERCYICHHHMETFPS